MKYIKAYGGQYGPGKIHIPRGWDPKLASSGLTLCGNTVHSVVVDSKDYEVTCKKCIKADHP